MKRLIVYDLDGTLVDTLEDIACAANHMLRIMQAPAVSPQEVRRHVGRGMHELVKGCLKTEELKRIEYGVKVYCAYYARHMLDHSRLYPGAQAVLDHFKQRQQAVITNKPTPFSHDILKALGVANYFAEIIAGDSGYPKKPDPTSVLSIMKKGLITPTEALLVGDSPIDIEMGRNAGVLTVSITHGLADEDELASAAPDVMVRNFEELLELAKRQEW
jgi:phosphoglycolate phosphatase